MKEEEEQLMRNGNENGEIDEDDTEDYRKTPKMSKSSRMLQYIKRTKIEATFPNICKAIRIFETIAICNASGERSFSGLKRIKGPLRSAETQEMLNDLSILYMNSDILQKIDYVIELFSLAKARRKTFQFD